MADFVIRRFRDFVIENQSSDREITKSQN